jgi:hypothetical protein
VEGKVRHAAFVAAAALHGLGAGAVNALGEFGEMSRGAGGEPLRQKFAGKVFRRGCGVLTVNRSHGFRLHWAIRDKVRGRFLFSAFVALSGQQALQALVFVGIPAGDVVNRGMWTAWLCQSSKPVRGLVVHVITAQVRSDQLADVLSAGSTGGLTLGIADMLGEQALDGGNFGAGEHG